jgi:hypothetical protein
MGTTLMPQIGNEQRDAKETRSRRCVKDKQNRMLKRYFEFKPGIIPIPFFILYHTLCAVRHKHEEKHSFYH